MEIVMEKMIKGYNGSYAITEDGVVISYKNNRHGLTTKGKVLSQGIGSHGYKCVSLEGKSHLVHRLVAEHFVENESNSPIVNHKDENKLNNNYTNLEWCDYKYNTTYNDVHLRKVDDMSIGIEQWTKHGEFVRTWKSAQEASVVGGFHQSNICACCLGKRKTHSGYVWKYIDQESN